MAREQNSIGRKIRLRPEEIPQAGVIRTILIGIVILETFQVTGRHRATHPHRPFLKAITAAPLIASGWGLIAKGGVDIDVGLGLVEVGIRQKHRDIANAAAGLKVVIQRNPMADITASIHVVTQG